MFDEQQLAVIARIVGIVRGNSPADAERSVLLAEVDEDYTCTELTFRRPAGPAGGFTAGEPAGADWTVGLSDLLLDLHDQMIAQGTQPRFGLTFTVDRDEFDVAVTLDMPDDYPWIDSLRHAERHGTP